MSRKSKNVTAVLFAIAALGISGCGVGNAPAPMSDSEFNDRFQKLSPQDQIKDVNMSAMPPAQKAAAIAKIEAQTGYKDPGTGGASPAPAASGQHYGG